jgi:O-antigen ligase
LIDGLDEAYWLGHGANTTEAISLAISEVAHPHNDWLRLRYEYGLLGMLLFALTMLGQMGHALRRLRRMPPEAAIFLWVGAGAFLPMALFMFSDNVILYAAWFGNLQFAMLGLGYAALKSVKRGGPTGQHLEDFARPQFLRLCRPFGRKPGVRGRKGPAAIARP